MSEIVQLFAQIALLRRGPQDVPASALLLSLTIVAYVAMHGLVAGLLPPISNWPAQLAVEVSFTLLWYAALLRLVGRPERMLQTVTAVFGFQTVLAPVVIASVWLVSRFGADATLRAPVTLLWLALLIWLVAANSHVVRCALEWSSVASVGLVLLQLATGQMLLWALFHPGA